MQLCSNLVETIFRPRPGYDHATGLDRDDRQRIAEPYIGHYLASRYGMEEKPPGWNDAVLHHFHAGHEGRVRGDAWRQAWQERVAAHNPDRIGVPGHGPPPPGTPEARGFPPSPSNVVSSTTQFLLLRRILANCVFHLLRDPGHGLRWVGRYWIGGRAGDRMEWVGDALVHAGIDAYHWLVPYPLDLVSPELLAPRPVPYGSRQRELDMAELGIEAPSGASDLGELGFTVEGVAIRDMALILRRAYPPVPGEASWEYFERLEAALKEASR